MPLYDKEMPLYDKEIPLYDKGLCIVYIAILLYFLTNINEIFKLNEKTSP